MKYIVVTGAEDTGKTALANAILGWDVLPLLPTRLPSTCWVESGKLLVLAENTDSGSVASDPDASVDLAQLAKTALIRHIWGMETLGYGELKQVLSFLLEGDFFVFPDSGKLNSCLLASDLLLTDTPGYNLTFKTIPRETARSVIHADTVIVLLSEEFVAEGEDIRSLDPDWDARQEREYLLLQKLLEKQKSRDIYFVIPFDHAELEGISLISALKAARERFSHLSCHGEAAFFCIDPILALIGEMEEDPGKINTSGILPLKQILFGERA